MTKFLAFLFRVMTGTSATVATLEKISGPTLAALLALFYDVMKFAVTEAGGVQQLATGNVQGGIAAILSEQTRALLAQIGTDYQSAKSQVVTDLHALGITGGAVNAGAAGAK